MRLRKLRPDIYNMTSRITLVSSFLASLFVGSIAPIDISDVCGVNLWDIKAAKWNEVLLRLTAGDSGSVSLKQKLGDVNDQQLCIGPISNYFVQRFGFNANCAIVPFTGDNPSTILALPLRPLDVMVSLGTSTTLLMSTPKYVPDPAYHFFNHPTSKGLYMFMLCYKNGGLAREGIRNALPCASNEDSWSNFNRRILSTPPLGQPKSSSPIKLGLYFPLPEIVPNVRAGTWRYSCSGDGLHLQETTPPWSIEDDARAIVESQILSLRLRSRNLVESPEVGFPPQPRRIYLVGGGSFNPAIAQVVGEVLGGTEGVWRLGVGGNACALGGAYKALWSVEKKETQSFDDLIRERWKEDKNVKKVDRGYRKEIWEKYGNVLGVFEEMERRVLAQENKTCKSLT
jgi:xylulokinase